MATKMIPLSRLGADLQGMLSECCDTGAALVIELPDHRLLTIQPLNEADDDSLIGESLEFNPSFQALVARSKASPRKPFTAGSQG